MKNTLREIEEWPGHRDPQPVRVARQILLGLVLGAAAIAIAALTSCTLTVAPDGTRVYGTDSAAVVKAIEILAEK